MDIIGTVQNGPISQFGWVDQVWFFVVWFFRASEKNIPVKCTDISIQPQNGTPPYTLTVRYVTILHIVVNLTSPQVAPSLHPPYNLTSDSMHPINWTVSLVCRA